MLECSRVIEGDISKVDNLHVRSAGSAPLMTFSDGRQPPGENVTFDEID